MIQNDDRRQYILTGTELKEIYAGYATKCSFDEMNDDLTEFLKLKTHYLKHRTQENRAVMKIAYNKIYADTKQLLNVKIISQRRFFELTDCLHDYDIER